METQIAVFPFEQDLGKEPMASFLSQLRQAVEQETARRDLASLSRAAVELSENYRAQRPARGVFIASEADRLAYVAVRLPATFAAVRAVFAEVRRLMPEGRITSLLDLGAGPGTAGWAAMEVFEELREITLVERDEGWIRMGRALAKAGGNALIENADWVRADLRAAGSFPAHDLVVASYALGEVERKIAREVLRAAWAAARAALVVIEPGTTAGFELIRLLREDLIGLGGHLIAPCPHQGECPMSAGDWCHFSQRLERSSLHRRLKAGELGHEDEKFSYVAASKGPVKPARARVLRHPLRRSGHAQLLLCAGEGIQTVTVTRSDKEAWRRARKTDWGDAWP
jgi:ribosomal protein RSM22 (predicted rRNA methylase)